MHGSPQLRLNGVAESNPRFHASRVIGISLHVLRNFVATALVLVYFLYGFAIFPRTRTLTDGLLKFLGPPLRDADKAFENYVPNLGYLFVILLFGWILRKALKYFFTSVERGTIVFASFPVEWAEPTYKLSRTVLFPVDPVGELSLSARCQLAIFSRILTVLLARLSLSGPAESLGTCWLESC